MKSLSAPAPFSEAAAYYARHRAAYAREAIGYVIERFGLGRGVRVLDLGCGPGTLAIALAQTGAEVTAVDMSSEMLDEARRLAGEHNARSIRWLLGRAEDVLPVLGTFRLAVFGQSLHWMDRDRVLRDLGDHLEDDGGLAIVDGRSGEDWGPIVRPILARYFGALDRHPLKHPESAHEPSLARSARFSAFTVERFTSAYSRDPASVLGFLYSCVGVSKAVLGDRVEEFESEVQAALTRANPSGVFHERTDTAVYVAMKAPAGG